MQKAMAPHSSTLAWKIPWMEEPGRLQSMGSHTTERLHFHFSLSCIGEGNGNPLQCSCLENPRDRGAWWAAVYGVAQSQTWLKWLSSRGSKGQIFWQRYCAFYCFFCFCYPLEKETHWSMSKALFQLEGLLFIISVLSRISLLGKMILPKTIISVQPWGQIIYTII